MENFEYNINTKIFFGKGSVAHLGEEVKKRAQRVLLLYGAQSIKQNGLYTVIIKQLQESCVQVYELGGIVANPRIESVYEGATICKEHSIELILAVGGGSIIDCAKAIAAQAKMSEDIWTTLYVNQKMEKLVDVLPVASILTLSATGSEMNGNSVISNMTERRKLAIGSDLLRPVFSILDPEYTYTVDKYQTAAGVVDMFSHVCEQYFSEDTKSYLQDSIMESLLKTIMKYGKIVHKDPKNYEARATIMWAGSLALNGLLSYGKSATDWSTHMMEHELSAYYDITHAVGLAIITPAWMKYVLSEKTAYKFANYGRNIFSLEGDSDMEIAKRAIEMTESFFISLGIPTKLHEVGIDSKDFEVMAKGATAHGPIGNMKSLTKEDIISIYKGAL
ncbi:MAG: iron-containing alcohol dehydrogenase [Desulfovibrionaceae bacterium]